jgi:hypothetical protein
MLRTPAWRISAKVILCGRTGSGMAAHDSADHGWREAARGWGQQFE